MQTCVATWCFGGIPPAAQVEKAIACGFKAVSCSLSYQALREPQTDSRIVELINEHELVVVRHNALGDSKDAAQDERLARDLDHMADWHERMGRVRSVCFDPGYYATPEDPNKWIADMAVSARRLTAARHRLEPFGIPVGMENWSINPTLDYFETIRELTGGGVGCLVDVGHLNIAWRLGKFGRMTPAEWITGMPLDIIEIHVHDNDGTADQHLAVGDGTLELEPMVEALAARGFNGVATIEHGGPADDQATVDAVCRTKDIIEDLFTRQGCHID